jgi:DnaJ-class molecular chaperone
MCEEPEPIYEEDAYCTNCDGYGYILDLHTFNSVPCDKCSGTGEAN